MIEKVNPSHPDKVADRIAGAIVDLAYKKQDNPKIAVEVLIGHGVCHVIAETSVSLDASDVISALKRIAGNQVKLDYKEVPQDVHLAKNQSKEIRCGDNGIFRGIPTSDEERLISTIVRASYDKYPTDGKFILGAESFGYQLIACQSNVDSKEYREFLDKILPGGTKIVNPLGEWSGGTNVDTGATNRKLGSDMGRAVTGGGLHGKDLSKADVAVNIACHILAQQFGMPVEACCAIGASNITFNGGDGCKSSLFVKTYEDVVDMASEYIFSEIGGFEKLAEWGLF